MTRFQKALLVAVVATGLGGFGWRAAMSDPLPYWLSTTWVPLLAGASLFFTAVAVLAWAFLLVLLLGRIAKWVWTGTATAPKNKAGPAPPVLTIGDVEIAQFRSGGALFLPLRIGPMQQADVRVVLTINRAGSEQTPAASYDLKTEDAIERGDRQAGRVKLDDEFKRFEIMSCNAASDTFLIEAQAGDYFIPRDNYVLNIAVAGAGPAQRREYVLQDEGNAIRISGGTDKSARRLLLHRA